MANTIYGAIGLTGGTTGFLDAIDGAILQDKDICVVALGSIHYVYTLDDDSGAAESSPNVIAPDSNPGTKRWLITYDGSQTAWTSYGASTTVGWAFGAVGSIYYKCIGNAVFVAFSIDGTSDATTASFTVPWAAIAGVDFYAPLAYGMDNATALTVPGLIFLDAETSLVNLYTTQAAGIWTASNNKIVKGQFWYSKA